MKHIAVLISNGGSGSNLQSLINAIESKKLTAIISLVVSDTKDAQGLQRARKHKIPTYLFDVKKDILEHMFKKLHIDYVILTGWKKIIPESFIHFFKNRIINIHPGLIPNTLTGFVKNPDGTRALWNRGKFTERAVKEFLDRKSSYAGSTIHFLSEEFDFGKVLARDFEKIQKNDTVESLYKRIKVLENNMLVKVMQKLTHE